MTRRLFGCIVILTFIAALAGCNRGGDEAIETALKKDALPVNSAENADGDSEEPIFEPIEVPEELMTPALRAMGGPSFQAVRYRVIGLPGSGGDASEGEEERFGARITRVTSVEGGKVTFTVLWTGGLQQFRSEQYESTAEGLTAVRWLGVPIDPPFTYLDADLTEGRTWSDEFSLEMDPETGTVYFSIRYTVLGRQEVTVPLGTFDAIVIEEEGRASAKEMNIRVKGRTWFAEGVGIVKATSEQNGTRRGETISEEFDLVAIPPEED
ncbi:MAG: hypothetical protein IH851_03605 [Armatimonadetes bacterium]|nr:hypothetical protein [Armatimonadota bacterium]